MTEFAGFSYPKITAMLPRDPLSKRLEEYKRTHGKRVFGPYYANEPHPNSKGGMFYLESDFMPGLRWEWADEVDGARIEHTGWFTDEYGDGDKIRGLVLRLPHGRGFLAGWSMGEGMASTFDYDIWDDIVECARDADRMAERAAEDEREYQAKEREEFDKAERLAAIADELEESEDEGEV